jgi:hypothetical protein
MLGVYASHNKGAAGSEIYTHKDAFCPVIKDSSQGSKAMYLKTTNLTWKTGSCPGIKDHKDSEETENRKI